MAKWIRKVSLDKTNFRVSIPLHLISEMRWDTCKYVTIDPVDDDIIIIRRMPGDRNKNDGS